MVMIKIQSRGKTIEYSMDGYYKNLLDEFKNAVTKHNTSIVIIFDGKSGKGKTTKANQTGKYLDHNYSIDNVYFTPESFLKGLADAKPETFHLFDEAMIISSRSVLSKRNRMIVYAMSMIRSKRLYVGFCVNSIFDLDKNLVLSRADCLVHVYGDGLIDRGKMALFFKSVGDSPDRLKLLYLYGKKFYSYSKPKSNFFASFTKKFIIDEKEYEKRKQEAVNNFLRKEEDPKDTTHFQKLLSHLKDEGSSVKELSNIVGIKPSTIYYYLGLEEKSDNK